MNPPLAHPNRRPPLWMAGLFLVAAGFALCFAQPDPVPVPGPAAPATPTEGSAHPSQALDKVGLTAGQGRTRFLLIPTGAASAGASRPAKSTPFKSGNSPGSNPGPSSTSEASGERRQGEVVEEGGKLWVRDTPLNELFQFLAEQGGFQYFHNAAAEGPEFTVTGHLNAGEPLEQMEELGLMYGITVYQKGSTVYALTSEQLSKLPQRPMQYHLKYLRPADIEQIKAILQPVLSPGSGTIDYEKKTNTLIVFDNEQRLEDVQEMLREIDQPKQQVAIETKILRVRSTARNRIGVDWSSVLGEGLTVEAVQALNTLFNLPELESVDKLITQSRRNLSDVSVERRNETGLVLSPIQLRAVLHALNSGNLAQQESCPTLITEDNEEGLITIIDRVPIIISTISQTDFGQNVSEEVRYRVDPQDSVEPATSREIGVTVSVTPTILPDDTIRMQLRPRTAQIVEFVEGQSGNSYPRVNESTIQTIARVPNGHSLLIGGVYDVSQSDSAGKVPFLGDVPIGNFIFKSTDRFKEQTSLVFVVTPSSYEPVCIEESDGATRFLHEQHVLPLDHASPDRTAPGFNYESRPRNALANLFNRIPPSPPANSLLPDHPIHQVPADDQTYTKVLRLRDVLFNSNPKRPSPAQKRAARAEVAPAP